MQNAMGAIAAQTGVQAAVGEAAHGGAQTSGAGPRIHDQALRRWFVGARVGATVLGAPARASGVPRNAADAYLSAGSRAAAIQGRMNGAGC